MSDDEAQRQREPAFTLRGLCSACRGMALVVHAVRIFAIPIGTVNRIVALFALVPARFTIALHLSTATHPGRRQSRCAS